MYNMFCCIRTPGTLETPAIEADKDLNEKYYINIFTLDLMDWARLHWLASARYGLWVFTQGHYMLARVPF